MKKFISMMMALAMTFALAIPAFASSVREVSTFSASGSAALASSGQYNFAMTGSLKVPTINVYVPVSGDGDQIILNPYGLKYTLGSQANLTDQVISTPIVLGSLSDVAMKVGMTVKATTAGNAALATKSLAEDTKTTTNSVFMWGQVVGVSGESDKVTALPTFATEYDETAGKSGDMILVKAGDTGSTRTGLYTIPPSSDPTDVAKTNWACVKFSGNAVKAPTIPWANTDKVDLAITFTFTPSMNEA